MKRSRFTEEQIVKVLKLQENGLKVIEICRQNGICEQTFYRWKSKYGGMGVSEVRRLKELEAENRRLKQLVGEKELDILALKAALGKKY
jgi:putative transposase